MAKHSDVVVRAKLKNAGSVSTDDVVQIYVKDPASAYAVPNHSLCAFQRVSLQADESKEIEIKVRGEAFLVETRRVSSKGAAISVCSMWEPVSLTAERKRLPGRRAWRSR